MQWVVCFSLFTFHFSLLSAQHHGMCDSAIEIGYANIDHLQQYASGTPNVLLAKVLARGMYFEKPHSVVWFTFVVPCDTVLTFTLVPSNHTDDLDFLLFKDGTGNICQIMHSNKRPIPVRANIANNAFTTSGNTGLSDTALNDFGTLGKHSAFSKSLKVKKGERYYLAVDNFTRADGPFTLNLHLHFPGVEPQPKPKPDTYLRPLSASTVLKLIVMDSAGNPVKARIKLIKGITKFHTRTLLDTSGVSTLAVGATPKEQVEIICLSQGYLLHRSSIRIPDTATLFCDTVRLEQIKEQRSIVLQDIEFEPEQDIFLPGATEPLSELQEFMMNNPAVHILIKGYVNDPFTQNSVKYDMELSERRAKAVMKYLSDKGIDASRMQWKGFGNKDMLYPNPKTMDEERANRRVEIEMK